MTRASQEIAKLQTKEDLFCLLDDNFDKYFRGKNFWRELHKLDKELTPGGIYVEKFACTPGRNLANYDDTSDDFGRGEKTLVIGLKTEETALNGAKLLNYIFHGCGTEFVAEEVKKNGQPRYQIRSNIDKRHWEKLCVFLHWRFEREVTDPEERTQLRDDCKQVLDAYTKDTPHYPWEATEGLPAFCLAMGLHGNLRHEDPKHRRDPKEIERELNEPHPRGTPLMFEDIPLHVRLRRDGSAVRCVQPYDIGYNRSRAALTEVMGDDTWLALFLETLGGNPFKKGMSPNRRIINSNGLFMGTLGFITGGDFLLGRYGPTAAGAAGAAFIGVGFIDHQWHIVNSIHEKIKRHRAKKQEPAALPEKPPLEWMILPQTEEKIDPALHAGYTREGGPNQPDEPTELEREAFSTPHLRQLQKLLKENSPQSFTEAALASRTGELKRGS